MNKPVTELCIGIPAFGSKEWLGGVSYTELLVKAVRALPVDRQPKLYIIFSDLDSLELYNPFMNFFDGLVLFGPHLAPLAPQLPADCRHFSSHAELFTFIDFYFPANSSALPNLPAASWIPDFQHRYLPEFFSREECLDRDSKFLQIAESAPMVVFSSKDAENDFRRFYPNSNVPSTVLSFYSVPIAAWYSIDPMQIQASYLLPDRFLICCNQFWTHKNHLRLIEAVAILKREGITIPLVCTGATHDYRAKGYFEQVKQRIHDLQLQEQIYILGTIPRSDQIQLIRRALAVVQPSLFEGWSTVVEDSRVLGKTVILSDLAVHKEQNPAGCIFFDRLNPAALARVIQELLPQLQPGPDLAREEVARAHVLGLAQGYGRAFVELAVKTSSYHEDRYVSGVL